MPSNWSIVDATFPTFKGNEQPKEQIGKLVNYMRVLTEQLQYSLDNLDTSNWNAKALKDFSDEATDEVIKLVSNLTKQLEQLRTEVNSQGSALGDLNNLPGRMQQAETEISHLEKTEEDHEERLQDAEERIDTAQADIDELDQRIRNQETVVKKEDDIVTLGSEGKVLKLVGEIYINGVLYKQAEENEI